VKSQLSTNSISYPAIPHSRITYFSSLSAAGSDHTGEGRSRPSDSGCTMSAPVPLHCAPAPWIVRERPALAFVLTAYHHRVRGEGAWAGSSLLMLARVPMLCVTSDTDHRLRQQVVHHRRQEHRASSATPMPIDGVRLGRSLRSATLPRPPKRTTLSGAPSHYPGGATPSASD